MSFTHEDILFESTGHGLDYEFGAQIRSLPDLPFVCESPHLLFDCFRYLFYITIGAQAPETPENGGL